MKCLNANFQLSIFNYQFLKMKVGDKVRFLSSIGGGIVRSFQGKDIVLVEEEDGFETPVLIRECVVIEENDTQTRHTPPPTRVQPEPVPVIEMKKVQEQSLVKELPGGDRLNVYIAYLPEDIKDIVKGNYEAYLINDSNYFLLFNYMSRENNAWQSLYNGLIEPNTKMFLHEFSKENLNSLEHVCIQFVAYKQDKPYTLKNSYSVEIRVDTVKFYKIHCFRENDFFEDDAIVYPVVINDVPEREYLVSSVELQESMMQKKKEDKRLPQPIEKKVRVNPVEEVDLHINQLLDSTTGMSNADILEYQLTKFREVLEKMKDRKGQKIVFIHGKGDGVLRNAILTELKTKYKNYPCQDASFREYGFGATMVTIK